VNELITRENVSTLDFAKSDNLLPAVVQHVDSGAVLGGRVADVLLEAPAGMALCGIRMLLHRRRAARGGRAAAVLRSR